MDAFSIEKRRINLKHERRENVRDINVLNSGNVSFLGQEKNRSGLLQVRDIFWETPHESFS